MKDRGEMFCDLINQVLPCFFKNLNSTVHRYESKEYSLYGSQIKVINAVKITQPIAPAELSRVLDVPKGSLTTIIKSLVEMKLLKKSYSNRDKRRYSLSITERAEKLLKKKNQEDALKYEMIFAGMSDDEFDKTVEGLTTMVKYFSRR